MVLGTVPAGQGVPEGLAVPDGFIPWLFCVPLLVLFPEFVAVEAGLVVVEPGSGVSPVGVAVVFAFTQGVKGRLVGGFAVCAPPGAGCVGTGVAPVGGGTG